MNTRIFGAFLIGALLTSCSSTKNSANDLAISNPIESAIHLDKVSDDKAPVEINPGRFTTETVTYRLPKVIQGTYAVSSFGRYIDDFKAFDYEGNEMPATKIDDNSWTINNAKKLDKITYLVNDTYDIEINGGIGKDVPFSPGGTNIEPENYVLNLHGFIGYFDSLKNNQYKLDVTGSADYIRTSALQNVSSKVSEDGKTITTSYFANRYFEITDNPMMFGNLDVEEFQVGNIKIVLSVYSPNNVHSAKSLKETFFKMMQAQKTYMGDIDSTPRYDIYVYLSEGKEDSPKGFGALEHHTSTVVVMPEAAPADAMAQSMIDIVSHEFFHIVTPLSVHSEDVHYFDYNKPTFSKHLWMYEGVTEYFAQHFQVYEGLVGNNQFYNTVMQKIATSMNLDDAMSFTIMSENVLDEPYATNYYNVYMKGALIGMCIDILMRKESNGERSMLSLMKELSNKYGKNKPFEDDKIIEEITAMTYPSIGEFFKTHVEGDVPINYDEFFDMVGLAYGNSEVSTNYIFAGGQNIIFDADPQKGEIFFSEMALKNSFWVSQGVQVGDVIKKVDGKELTLMNAQEIITGMYGWQEGQEIDVELNRNGETVSIKTVLTKATAESESLIEDPNASVEKVALRNAWLKK